MTTQAENHLILIDAARAMHERHRQLLAASRESIAVEYEDLNDSLGQTLECVTLFEFADGSALHRREGKTMWRQCSASISGCGGCRAVSVSQEIQYLG